MSKIHRKSPKRAELRRRFVALVIGIGLVTPVSWSEPLHAQGNAPTRLEVKLTGKARDAKRSDKSKELKAGTSLDATMQYYSEYLIPLLTQVDTNPAKPDGSDDAVGKIADVNLARKDIVDDDIGQALARASKPFRAEYNRRLLGELYKVIRKDAGFSTTSRVLTFHIAMQLYSEPAGNTPAVTEPRVYNLIEIALDPTELDAIQYMAVDTLEKSLKIKPTDPKDAATEEIRLKITNKLAPLLTVVAPYHRLPEAHQKMMEQSLLAMTALATTGDPKAESTKIATAKVASFVLEVLQDARSSEWLKEISCMCFGHINLAPDTYTPEQITTISNEIAKFGLKSDKLWRAKVASSGPMGMGSGGSGYGSGGYGSESGGYPGGSGGPGGPGSGGYGGEGEGSGIFGGYGGAPTQSRAPQPADLKNARRLLNQRLERIHVALNGATGAASAQTASRPESGLIKIIPEDEKYKIKYAIEKLQELQKVLNDTAKFNDLNALRTLVASPMYELRVAFKDFSGEQTTTEDPTFSPFGPFGGAGVVGPGAGGPGAGGPGAGGPGAGGPGAGGPGAGGPGAGGPGAGGPGAGGPGAGGPGAGGPGAGGPGAGGPGAGGPGAGGPGAGGPGAGGPGAGGPGAGGPGAGGPGAGGPGAGGPGAGGPPRNN
ncbi:hypothetical protein VN12_17280 [Pirellula sp. SH-Sr6A]|uniref:hypothetical protein n=1 Tax=Pirellula sp. SH-Sr6A TaxID=1632865 RepID=UPI00078D3F43|nr:hypothetical protein [Pirellula sp. SH-Sr6A]AMV33885.1 hypothetical protein VN12_17280 [Pirellula sp. SH-Sr6A]